MQPRSAIAKGKRLEDYVAHQVELAGLGTARREIGSGSGKRKGDLAWELPYTPEIKNEAGVPQWLLIRIEQARKQALGIQPWLLIFRDPNTPEYNPTLYAVMDFQDWLARELKVIEPKTFKSENRTLQFKLKTLLRSAKSVLQEIEP